MTIWLLLPGIFIIALAALVVPMYRTKAREKTSGQHNIGVYKAQLKELEADQKNGVLNDDEAASAKLEIERRLLKAATDAEAGKGRENNGFSRPLIFSATSVALLASAAFYLMIGNPGMPDFVLKDQPHSMERQAERNAASQEKIDEIKQEITDIELHLASNPENVKAWHALGQYHSQLQNKAAAAQAFQKWYELEPENIDAAVVYGESLIMLSEGRVGPAALLVLNKARKIQPRNPGIRHYLSLAAYQSGNVQQALAGWKSLREESKPGVPWLRQLDRWIRRAERDLGIPTANETGSVAPALSAGEQKAIAEMSPEEQADMIKSMVGRLQDKMNQNPTNIEGWFRLAKAYMVLGQKDDAINSLKQAEKYASDDLKPEIKKQLEILQKQE